MSHENHSVGQSRKMYENEKKNKNRVTLQALRKIKIFGRSPNNCTDFKVTVNFSLT